MYSAFIDISVLDANISVLDVCDLVNFEISRFILYCYWYMY